MRGLPPVPLRGRAAGRADGGGHGRHGSARARRSACGGGRARSPAPAPDPIQISRARRNTAAGRAIAQALAIGASKVFVEDIREEFVQDYVYPAIQANAIYEDRYLLGTSLARYPIAKRAVELARQVLLSHSRTWLC